MKLPRDLSGKDIIKALQRLGFISERQQGSHVRLKKDHISLTVPLHRIVAPGTLGSILRQAEVPLKDLLKAMR